MQLVVMKVYANPGTSAYIDQSHAYVKNVRTLTIRSQSRDQKSFVGNLLFFLYFCYSFVSPSGRSVWLLAQGEFSYAITIHKAFHFCLTFVSLCSHFSKTLS